MARRRRQLQEGRPRDGRQEPQHRVRRRRLRDGRRQRADRRVHPLGPGLLGRLPGDRPGRRSTTGSSRRSAGAPTGSGSATALDDATEAGALITAEHRAKVEAFVARRHRRGRPAGGRRPPPRRARAPGRLLLPPDGLRRRHAATMRIVREEVFGPVLTDRAVHDRGRGDRARQRHDLRARRRGLDRRRRAAPSGSPPACATGRSGSTTTTRTCRRRSGAASSSPGIGRELGPTGLDEYREAKHIWQNTKPGPSGWFGG